MKSQETTPFGLVWDYSEPLSTVEYAIFTVTLKCTQQNILVLLDPKGHLSLRVVLSLETGSKKLVRTFRLVPVGRRRKRSSRLCRTINSPGVTKTPKATRSKSDHLRSL